MLAARSVEKPAEELFPRTGQRIRRTCPAAHVAIMASLRTFPKARARLGYAESFQVCALPSISVIYRPPSTNPYLRLDGTTLRAAVRNTPTRAPFFRPRVANGLMGHNHPCCDPNLFLHHGWKARVRVTSQQSTGASFSISARRPAPSPARCPDPSPVVSTPGRTAQAAATPRAFLTKIAANLTFLP